jgi:hypothetical protein
MTMEPQTAQVVEKKEPVNCWVVPHVNPPELHGPPRGSIQVTTFGRLPVWRYATVPFGVNPITGGSPADWFSTDAHNWGE